MTAWAYDAPPPILAVALEEPGCVRFYTSVDRLPGGGLTNDLYKTTWMVMRRIPAAGVTWTMGTPLGEIDSSKTGHIAVKVINHFGDEVMKVFEV